MMLALLDELPCLLDEADYLMARLSCHMTQLKIRPKGAAATQPTGMSSMNQDLVRDSSKTIKKSLSPHSKMKSRKMTENRHALDDIDMDPIIKFFTRHYVTMQSMSFEKMNANLPVGGIERSALYAVSTSIYQLMKRLQHWQQAAWESLARFFTDNSSEMHLLTFDSHPQLTRLVLTTFAKYVKVNLLWSSFRVIPGFLALYSLLHHIQTVEGDTLTGAIYSPLEHTDHRVREFVLHFGTAPLLAIQQDFQLVRDKGASLAALTLSCFERYEACRDLVKLRQQGVFDLESLVSGAYASHSSLSDLVNVSNIVDWVICVVLCVPHQLQGADRYGSRSTPLSPISPSSQSNSPSLLQLWDFMEIIARDRLVLTLHRNHVINLHELLYQQVTSSLTIGAASSSSFGKSRSSLSPKKMMNALSKFALRNCGANHQQRREIATWLLQSCELLMQHNPGLVAPSFPLLLAALSIARDEIEWAMCHRVSKANTEGSSGLLLPSHVKAKHLQRVASSFSGAETELASLLTHSHRLRGLIEQHSHLLTEYYQVFLLNGDAEGIVYSIQELFAANESMSELQPLLEGFLDNERYRINISSLRATWVREWRQTNAQLTMRAQIPLFDVLRARMECAVRHTEYICVNAQFLERVANFSKCWWFCDVAFGQCFEQTLITAPPFSIGLLEILSSLVSGNYVLDELIDTQEVGQQSEQMLQRINRMQASLVDLVESGLEAVVKRDVNLQRDERSISQEEKTESVENKVTASSRRLSSFSLVQSSQVQRPSNVEFRLASPTSSFLRRNSDINIINPSVSLKLNQLDDEERYIGFVRALLVHVELHQNGTIVKTSIVDRVRICFIRFLRGFVTFSTGFIGGVRWRCSLADACLQIRCFLRATQRLFGCNNNKSEGISGVSIGGVIQEMLAKVLADECSSASMLPHDKRLLEWATESPHTAEKELEQWSLVDRISWLFVSLVTMRCYSSPTAPGSLPSVLAAVRKSCFVLAPGVSGELDPREYTDPEALQYLVDLVGSVGVESICSTITNLLISQTLKLRSAIEAEHAVLSFMDMAMSSDSSADVILATAQVRAMDDIATQLIQIGTTVFLLQLLHVHSSHDISDVWCARVAPQLLRELQQDPDRRATWTRLLPVACSAGFHSSVWKRTTYLSSVEATDTNAHLMGLAMARLLSSSHSCQTLHQCAVAALKRSATSTSGAVQTKAEPSTRPLLHALELLVSTAMSTGDEDSSPQGSTLEELELSLERLLPHAVMALHQAA